MTVKTLSIHYTMYSGTPKEGIIPKGTNQAIVKYDQKGRVEEITFFSNCVYEARKEGHSQEELEKTAGLLKKLSEKEN